VTARGDGPGRNRGQEGRGSGRRPGPAHAPSRRPGDPAGGLPQPTRDVDPPVPADHGRDREGGPSRKLERIGDLLPRTARELGLEDQLEQAEVAAAWDRVVAARVPAAAGSCRLVALDRGIATIEVDLPIVGQEIRLRSSELLAALRSGVRIPVVSLQVTVRHV
jgi:hypothetical protein